MKNSSELAVLEKSPTEPATESLERIFCLSAAGALRHLEVETHTLSIDENRSRIDQLLAGAVVAFVATQCLEREEKLHCHGTRTGSRFCREMNVRAEAYPIKL